VVLAEGEAEHPPGGHVQDRVQVELALIGGYLGAIAIPLAVDLGGGEVPLNQVWCPPPALARPGGAFALGFLPRRQVLLAHQRRDGVLAHPPPFFPQVSGDPRRPVPALMQPEQARDLSFEPLPAPRARRLAAVFVLAEP
jgi:hypothetical protein